MRETPQYSLVEIRLLLAQYLDGTLAMEQMLHVDDLMEQYPDYREEFLKLQAAQNKIQQALQTPIESSNDLESDEDNATWLRIAEQLEQDRDKPVSSVSPEWISAYIDGEIPREDAQRDVFESQLAHDPEHARLLAEFQEISEAIRQFGYRQESHCALNIAEQVLAQFQAEQIPQTEQAEPEPSPTTTIDQIDETESVDPEWEMLSAFSDQALTPREIIQATQLLESSEGARMHLATLNGLSAGIQRVGECLQNQAPDIWPAISDEVRTALQLDKASSDRTRRLRWLKHTAIPIAATVLFGLLSLSSLHLMTEPAASPQNPHSSLAQQQFATSSSVNTQELASVPGHSADSVRLIEYSRSSLDDQSAMTTDQHAGLKPMLEQSASAIAADTPNSVLPANTPSSRKTPSSEAYLFDALNKKATEEEISNILGK